MGKYFAQTEAIKETLLRDRENGRRLSVEEQGIVSVFPKGAAHHEVVQAILAMSIEELECIKRDYCATLQKEMRSAPSFAVPAIETLIGVYSSLTPDEFRQSMLHPSVLGTVGNTELRNYAINSSNYVNRGVTDQDSIGMRYDYSKDDIEHPYLTEPMQGLIRTEAQQRAQDIRQKLQAGMSLDEALHGKKISGMGIDENLYDNTEEQGRSR